MSSNARKGSPPRSSNTGVTTSRTSKARVFVFLTLVILTAVFSANALTATATAANADTAVSQESGFIASSFNNILSFFGYGEAKPAADKTDKSGCDTAPEGLLACYRGDLDATDAKGVHNGDWVGTYGFATGKVGAGAFSFNGQNRVEVPNAADLNPANVTVDGWVNLSNADGSFGIISKGDAYSLSVRGGHVVFTSRNAAGVVESVEAPASFKTGTWSHVAATHDGSMRRIYVDGVEVVSARQKGLFVGDESGLTIGSTVTTEAAFVGLADEVKVFGRALSAKEIAGIAGNAPNSTENITAFSVTPSSVVEGNQVLTVSITRDNTNAGGAISVNFVAAGSGGSPATGGVSCSAGIDYVFGASSIGFVANETGTKTTTINICADTLVEGDETFTVTASIAGPGDVITAANPVTVTIVDDDKIAITPPAAGPEGTGATNNFDFVVDRGPGATAASPALVVPFTMSGTAVFTATADIDYNLDTNGGNCGAATVAWTNQALGQGSLTFPAANTSQTCRVRLISVADDVVENNNTATMTVAAPLGNPTASTTTINNDDNPWISVAVVGTSTSAGGVNGAQLVEEGTPQAGGSLDYTYTRGLCSASTPGNPTAACPGFELSALTPGQQANVSYTGTATSGTDYTNPGATVTFGGTSTATTISINPTDDIVVEIDETIIATVLVAGGAATNYNVDGNSNGGIPNQPTNIANGYINDDDEDVSVTVAPTTSLEDSGPNIIYTFTRTSLSGGADAVNGINPIADAISVNYTVGGTATNGTDYAAIASPLAIPALTATGTVTVDPTTDAIPENNETVILTIVANANQYGVGSPNATPGTTATATATILNDDFQVIVTGANPAQTLEDGATNLEYTFIRIGANAANPLVANFNTSGSANPVTGPDFVVTNATTYTPAAIGNSNGTISIPSGQGASAPIGGVETNQFILIVDPSVDGVVEPDENVLVQVDNGIGYAPGTPAQANGIILNDDAEVSVAVAPTAVLEDGLANLVYTFTRTGGCGSSLSVNYTTSGTATTANSDFTGTTTGANTVVFAAGQCTASVTVDPTTDAVVETDETVVLTITASSGLPNQYTIAAPPANAATGTITNDDTGISVTASASIQEDQAPVITYTFTRTGIVLGALTVNYTLSGSPTLTNADFVNPPTLGPNTVAFAPGATTATVVVDAVADADVEVDEDVTVTITNGSGYTVGAPATATSQILNDDADIVCTGPTPASVNENSGTAMVYGCTRTGLTATALSVPFTFSGTATFTTDYTVAGNVSGVSAAGGTLNFAAGNNAATVSVTPVADVVVEDNETVIVTFTNPGVYSGYDFIPSPTVLTGTITNDDQDVSVAVSLTNPVGPGSTVIEDQPVNLLYTFTRVPGSAALLAAPLTVNFTTTGTATSGTDYTQSATGTITFAAGSTTATMVVDPTVDNVVEPDETVIITATAGTGYQVVAPTSATGTIANDDTTYTITFVGITGAASGAGREGNPGDPGDTIATFTVTRNGVNSPAGTVSVSTVPGSGTATAGAPNTTCQPGQDYTSDGQTLSFLAGGTTSQDFTVRICRDLAFELTETFDTQLSNPTGGFLGAPAVATATIIDDDAAPTLTITCPSVQENAGTATCTVTQSITSTLNTTFAFNTGAVGNTATPNVDYTSTTGTGTIAAGATTASIVIPIIDDNIDEPNENFTVTLTSATNATIATAAADVIILDNEPSTQFAINNVVQIEGNPSIVDPSVASTSAFNFRITRTGDAQSSEVVCFETVDGDIENPAINPNPATGGTGAIPPSNLGTPDYTTRAAGPTNCVTFTQGGPSVITVPVIVFGDSVSEFDESFTVRIISVNGEANPLDQANNPRIIDRLGLGVIQNDDGAPSISISGQTVTEGNTPAAGGVVTFTVTRTGSTANPVTATYATSTTTGTSAATAGTACAVDNAVDYVTRTGTVSIPANVASTTFTVTYCGDLYDELNESFTATLSNPSNGVIGTAAATATIIDDDAAPIISVSDVNVCEPETGTAAAVFTITRTGPSYLTSTVNVNTVDGTATTTDSDYVGILTPGGQVVTFAPTVTTATVTVTVNGDTKFETDETFTLQVVSASSDVVIDPVGGADPIGLGVIINSGAGCTGDAPPAFGLGATVQNEGTAASGTTTFYVRLTRTGTTQVPSTITYSTANISGQAVGGTSCSAGVDYLTVTNAPIPAFSNVNSGPVPIAGQFPAAGYVNTVGPPARGANFIDLPVEVCPDATFEPNETFNVSITPVQFASVLPAGSPAVVTIVNDDGLSFSIRNPGPSANEGTVGNTTFTFTIDRTGDSTVASNVCYQTVAGTATEGVDYTGLTAGAANCVNFTSGTTSANVSVTVIGDATPELDETFSLRLLSATAGTVGGGDRIATIINDDGPIPVPTGFEGDIVDGAGTNAGDNLVLANDVSAIRQAVLNGGIQGAIVGNVFQRADVNIPCGNGQLDSGDVTVIRQILLNATPLVAACGPTVLGGVSPVEADRSASPEVVGRIIRAVNTTGTAGQNVTVSFQLDSQGDEASASFTANWNPAVLTYVSAALGSGVPAGTNLGLNTSQTAQGRLGVLLDATNTYAAGTRQILTVTFSIAANATAGTYPVSFSSTPTAQSVSSAQGALLATTYETGNVVITTTAAGVRVSGRVTTANGQALRNATVVITDSTGNRRSVTTSSFGIYTFDDVEAGQSYVVGVQSKRFRFAARVINVTDSLADVDFVGQE